MYLREFSLGNFKALGETTAERDALLPSILDRAFKRNSRALSAKLDSVNL